MMNGGDPSRSTTLRSARIALFVTVSPSIIPLNRGFELDQKLAHFLAVRDQSTLETRDVENQIGLARIKTEVMDCRLQLADELRCKECE